MRVEAKIVFCDFRKVQGWRWFATMLLTRSRHTHAHIEFAFRHPFAFVIIDKSRIKAVRVSHLEKMGAKEYYTYPLGEIDISEEDVIYALKYPKANSVKMVFYQAIGKYIGMKMPTSCITFICDYLQTKGYDTPRLFTPRQLMEDLKRDDHYVRWSSQSRKDNAGQMAQ